MFVELRWTWRKIMMIRQRWRFHLDCRHTSWPPSTPLLERVVLDDDDEVVMKRMSMMITEVMVMIMVINIVIVLVWPGLHKLWYPSIRDTSTWSKFGTHGGHGDVFLFSNLGALWFSDNLTRYWLHVCLREVKNNLFSFKHSYLRHFSWRF